MWAPNIYRHDTRTHTNWIFSCEYSGDIRSGILDILVTHHGKQTDRLSSTDYGLPEIEID